MISFGVESLTAIVSTVHHVINELLAVPVVVYFVVNLTPQQEPNLQSPNYCQWQVHYLVLALFDGSECFFFLELQKK